MAKNAKQPPRIYYGWVMVVAMIFIGATSATVAGPTFGFFIEPMQNDLGFDRALFGWANTGRMLAAAFGGLFIGKMVDRHGPRVMLAVAGSISALAIMSLGFFHPSWWLIGAFVVTGIVGVQGQAPFYTGPSVAKWFIRRRAKALGILSMAAPLGLMLGFPLVQWVISNFGWRAGWVSLGVAAIVVVVPISLVLLRRQPEDIGLLPDGDSPDQGNTVGEVTSTAAQPEHQWTREEAIRTVAFWRLTLTFSLFVFSTTSMAFFRFPFFIDQGLGAGTIAIAASTAQIPLFLGASTIGRQVSAVGMERLVGINLLVLGLCFLITLNTSNTFMMFAAFYTFAWSTNAVGALQGITYAAYFGRQHAGAVRSAALTTTLLFASVSGPLAGFIADVTGDFKNIWWPTIGILAVASLLVATTRPPTKDVRTPVERQA